ARRGEAAGEPAGHAIKARGQDIVEQRPQRPDETLERAGDEDRSVPGRSMLSDAADGRSGEPAENQLTHLLVDQPVDPVNRGAVIGTVEGAEELPAAPSLGRQIGRKP